MTSVNEGRLMPVAGKSEWALSSVRPVTLLIASGIVLVAAILIVTGLAADYLRQRTLLTTEDGLGRLGAVLAEAGDRSLRAADQALARLADRLPPTETATPAEFVRAMAGPEIADLLRSRMEFIPQINAIALVGGDGTLINQAGAWPAAESSVVGRDYFTALRSHPEFDTYIGAPVSGDHAGAMIVPFAHKLRAAHGEFAGLLIGAIPVGDFTKFYQGVPLGDDGLIALVRRDGVVLAQYPPQPGAIGKLVSDNRLRSVLVNSSEGVIEEDRSGDAAWRIDSVRAFADYPVAVVVSRSGDQALVDWSRQAVVFGAFALCGALASALMVYLIARQFRTHSALAAVRAEKIEVEHARLVAEAELLKKDRLSVLGQLTATVAHELRNPLSAIRNTLFTMKEIATEGGVKLDRPISRMERSIERCDRIIGDLLEYTRTRELRRADIAFDPWLAEILAEHALPPTVKLVEELHAGEARVPIDAERIRRVVINLIDNAAQALGELAMGELPAAGRESRIVVRTAIANGALELGIADTGPGIPRDNLARIFEPLFSTKSFGTGLGLATVKQIVIQHGGSISVDSDVGQGTSIGVRLPLDHEVEVVE